MALKHNLLFWQAPGEECARFVRAHGVDLLPLRALGDDFAEARGDESRSLAPGVAEGAQILFAPGVVDNEKDAPVTQRFAELGGGGIQVFEAGALAVQDFDEVSDDREQVIGLLAKLDPENAV